MKKFGKFLFGTVSLATLACGAYYVYKNVINKDSTDDFDDFDDGFEDLDDDEDDEDEKVEKKDTREYVSINITSDSTDTKSSNEDLPKDDAKKEAE